MTLVHFCCISPWSWSISLYLDSFSWPLLTVNCVHRIRFKLKKKGQQRHVSLRFPACAQVFTVEHVKWREPWVLTVWTRALWKIFWTPQGNTPLRKISWNISGLQISHCDCSYFIIWLKVLENISIVFRKSWHFIFVVKNVRSQSEGSAFFIYLFIYFWSLLFFFGLCHLLNEWTSKFKIKV